MRLKGNYYTCRSARQNHRVYADGDLQLQPAPPHSTHIPIRGTPTRSCWKHQSFAKLGVWVWCVVFHCDSVWLGCTCVFVCVLVCVSVCVCVITAGRMYVMQFGVGLYGWCLMVQLCVVWLYRLSFIWLVELNAIHEIDRPHRYWNMLVTWTELFFEYSLVTRVVVVDTIPYRLCISLHRIYNLNMYTKN